MTDKATEYALRLRNKAKCNYALAYLYHLRHRGPEPERGHLSYMAAQAVRLELHRIRSEQAA